MYIESAIRITMITETPSGSSVHLTVIPQKDLSLMAITRTHFGPSVHLAIILVLHIDGNNQHPFRVLCPPYHHNLHTHHLR